MNNVVFEEDQRDSFTIPKRESGAMSKALIRFKFASSFKNASFLLAVGAFFVIVVSIYFIALSVPPTPELGPDILRPGENVPDYVR